MSLTSTSVSKVRLIALGQFRLETPSGCVDRLPTKKASALLAQLAIDARPHSREALQVEYWPDRASTQARASLRQALTMIRRVLPDPDALLSTDQMVEIRGIETDVAEFRSLSQSAVAAPESERIAALERALELYAEPLPDWTEPWVHDLRGELAAEALDLTIQLAQLLAPTDRAAALQWAQRALSFDPEDEEAQELVRELESNSSGPLTPRRRPWPDLPSGPARPAGAADLERVIQLYLDTDRDKAIEMLSVNSEILVSLGYRQVLPLYQQASKLTPRDSDHFGRVQGVLGQIYHRMGAYRQSSELLRGVVEWSRMRGQTGTEAQALISLGLIGLEQGNISPYHPAIGRLWEINRRAPRESAGAYGYSIEGAHRWHGGDVERGWQFVREAVRRATGEGFNNMARWNLANMCVVSWDLGILDAVQEFRSIGEQSARAFGDRYLSYAFEFIEGAELILQKRYEEAVLQLRPLVTDPRSDFSRLHILLCEALGLAAAYAGDIDVAVDALGRAYVQRRAVGHLPTVTERRQLRRAYAELERRIGTRELDRLLDLAIENFEQQRRNRARA